MVQRIVMFLFATFVVAECSYAMVVVHYEGPTYDAGTSVFSDQFTAADRIYGCAVFDNEGDSTPASVALHTTLSGTGASASGFTLSLTAPYVAPSTVTFPTWAGGVPTAWTVDIQGMSVYGGTANDRLVTVDAATGDLADIDNPVGAFAGPAFGSFAASWLGTAPSGLPSALATHPACAVPEPSGFLLLGLIGFAGGTCVFVKRRFFD